MLSKPKWVPISHFFKTSTVSPFWMKLNIKSLVCLKRHLNWFPLLSKAKFFAFNFFLIELHTPPPLLPHTIYFLYLWSPYPSDVPLSIIHFRIIFNTFLFVVVVCWLILVQLFATPWTVAHQAPLSMGFSRQEHWSGLPFPAPGDLPDPGTEPMSSALTGGFVTTESPGKPTFLLIKI